MVEDKREVWTSIASHQIVTEGAAVRNFVFKDGHLFLSGMAAGGYYELEPIPIGKR